MPLRRQKPNRSSSTTLRLALCVSWKSGTQKRSPSSTTSVSSLISHSAIFWRNSSTNIGISGGTNMPVSVWCDTSPSCAETTSFFGRRSGPHSTSAFNSKSRQSSSVGRNSASARPYFCVAVNRLRGPSSRSKYSPGPLGCASQIRRWNFTWRKSWR